MTQPLWSVVACLATEATGLPLQPPPLHPDHEATSVSAIRSSVSWARGRAPRGALCGPSCLVAPVLVSLGVCRSPWVPFGTVASRAGCVRMVRLQFGVDAFSVKCFGCTVYLFVSHLISSPSALALAVNELSPWDQARWLLVFLGDECVLPSSGSRVL